MVVAQIRLKPELPQAIELLSGFGKIIYRKATDKTQV
jgi:hypothetical protein